MDPSLNDPEQLVVQTLFADGHIQYRLFQNELDKTIGEPALQVLALKDLIVPQSLDQMTWNCGEYGFLMTLSRKVPETIGNSLEPFLESLAASIGLSFNQLKEEAYFAIHPGGPKINDQIEKMLSLREEQLSYSRSVLRDYGNMSSATLPHIWKAVLEDSNCPSGRIIISLAFGPGLTVAGGIFKKVDL